MLAMGDWSPISTALAIGVVSLLVVKLWQTYRYLTTFRRMGIPGPTPLPLVGNAWTFRKKDLRDVAADWNKQYGSIYGIFFPTPCLMIANKEMAKEVLVKQFAKFSDRPAFPGFNSGPFKDSLLSIMGDHWKHVRSQLSPTFSTNKLKQILPAIARVSKNLCQHLQKNADNGELIDLREICRNVTMDVIAGAAFGLEVDSLKNPDDQFHRHGQGMIDTFNNRIAFFGSFRFLEKIAEFFGIRVFPKSDTSYLMDVLDAAIKDRRLDKVGKMDYDRVMDLTYIDMCMNEAMRLYMPGLLQRTVTEDLDLGGLHVPKGMQAFIPPNVFHLDPEEWPNPMVFDPMRHTAEQKAKRHPFSFMPFGLGPRNCIGMRLAQVEIRMMIASILQQYTPVLCEKSVFPPVLKPMTAIARDGLWIKLKRRGAAN